METIEWLIDMGCIASTETNNLHNFSMSNHKFCFTWCLIEDKMLNIGLHCISCDDEPVYLQCSIKIFDQNGDQQFEEYCQDSFVPNHKKKFEFKLHESLIISETKLNIRSEVQQLLNLDYDDDDDDDILITESCTSGNVKFTQFSQLWTIHNLQLNSTIPIITHFKAQTSDINQFCLILKPYDNVNEEYRQNFMSIELSLSNSDRKEVDVRFWISILIDDDQNFKLYCFKDQKFILGALNCIKFPEFISHKETSKILDCFGKFVIKLEMSIEDDSNDNCNPKNEPCVSNARVNKISFAHRWIVENISEFFKNSDCPFRHSDNFSPVEDETLQFYLGLEQKNPNDKNLNCRTAYLKLHSYEQKSLTVHYAFSVLNSSNNSKKKEYKSKNWHHFSTGDQNGLTDYVDIDKFENDGLLLNNRLILLCEIEAYIEETVNSVKATHNKHSTKSKISKKITKFMPKQNIQNNKEIVEKLRKNYQNNPTIEIDGISFKDQTDRSALPPIIKIEINNNNYQHEEKDNLKVNNASQAILSNGSDFNCEDVGIKNETKNPTPSCVIS